MSYPEFIAKVFTWLPVDCHERRWCKEWKAREQKKNAAQRKLDYNYYTVCDQIKGGLAKQLLHLGATSDFIDDTNGGTTAFISLYSNENKEMIDELIRKYPNEYKKSTEVLLAIQKHYSAELRTKLESSFGPENWIEIWDKPKRRKDLNQVLKDAALWSVCADGKWELAAEWIDRGARNNFIDRDGMTALHVAAFKGSSKIVQKILDRFKEEIERKNEDFQSPLCYAFKEDQYDIAEIMIKKMIIWMSGRRYKVCCHTF